MNILITGGASGLGEAITRKLAGENEFNVFFTYHKSHDNAVKIQKEFPGTSSLKCDFANENDVNELKSKIEQINIDVLINNAYEGSFIKSYFHKTEPLDFIDSFKKNVLPTIAITQSAIHSFRKKKQGKIITVLTAALMSDPPIGSSVYVATKAYMEELTKVWATENAKFNIFSTAVSPSFMLTGLTSSMDERVIEEIKENQPLKRLLTTEEVAETIFSLIKNTSPDINGANIIINSGKNIK